MKNKINKALILAVGLIGLLGGCGINGDNKETNRAYNYRIVEIDSCEYIIFWDNKPNMAVVHKGNCKNPIHKAE